MHIQFFINERDYKSAALLAMRKRSNISALDYYGPYIVAVIWIAGSVVPNPFNNYLQEPADLLLTLGVIPIFIGVLGLRRKSMAKEYRKLRSLHPLQAVDIDGIGLRNSTTDAITRTDWKVYSRYAEDKDSFVLFHADSVLFFPVPKSNLTAPQVDELRALLEAHMPRA
jgi:YcxB-like protein